MLSDFCFRVLRPDSSTAGGKLPLNRSANTDPQLREAASPSVFKPWSSSRSGANYNIDTHAT